MTELIIRLGCAVAGGLVGYGIAIFVVSRKIPW